MVASFFLQTIPSVVSLMPKKNSLCCLPFQFVRFLVVGLGNTIFSYTVFAAFIWLGFPYKYASLLSLVLGIFFSFYMQRRWVFRRAQPAAIYKFILTWCLLYGLNVLIISFLISKNLNAYLAGAIAVIPVTLLSFFILKLAVFGLNKPLLSPLLIQKKL